MQAYPFHAGEILAVKSTMFYSCMTTSIIITADFADIFYLEYRTI